MKKSKTKNKPKSLKKKIAFFYNKWIKKNKVKFTMSETIVFMVMT